MNSRMMIIAAGYLFLCVGCTEEVEVPAHRIFPQKLEIQNIDDMGRYTRMVHLETHENALLGDISKVVVDPSNGDLLVSDKRVTHGVYRFNERGKFIRRYGRKGEGPGEYRGLNTFTVTPEGRVAVFSFGKRIVFNPDGSVFAEQAVVINDFYAEAVGNQFYVLSFNGGPNLKEMVSILSADLGLVEKFHPYDRRMEKIPFVPQEAMSVAAGKVVINDFSNLGFFVYTREGESLGRFQFPNRNDEIAGVWDQPREQAVRRDGPLATRFHRFQIMNTVGDWVHFLEWQGRDINRSVLWDPQSGQAFRFEGVHLLRAEADAPYLSMDGIVGSTKNNLIGYCADPEKFARFQKSYPAAKHIRYQDSDNPVLLFFQFHNGPLTTAKR